LEAFTRSIVALWCHSFVFPCFNFMDDVGTGAPLLWYLFSVLRAVRERAGSKHSCPFSSVSVSSLSLWSCEYLRVLRSDSSFLKGGRDHCEQCIMLSTFLCFTQWITALLDELFVQEKLWAPLGLCGHHPLPLIGTFYTTRASPFDSTQSKYYFAL
jgi:hypothetical protein